MAVDGCRRLSLRVTSASWACCSLQPTAAESSIAEKASCLSGAMQRMSQISASRLLVELPVQFHLEFLRVLSGKNSATLPAVAHFWTQTYLDNLPTPYTPCESWLVFAVWFIVSSLSLKLHSKRLVSDLSLGPHIEAGLHVGYVSFTGGSLSFQLICSIFRLCWVESPIIIAKAKLVGSLRTTPSIGFTPRSRTYSASAVHQFILFPVREGISGMTPMTPMTISAAPLVL